MRYPTLTIGHLETMIAERAKGSETNGEQYVVWRGVGESVSFEALDLIVGALRAELDHRGSDPALTSDKEPFEGQLALAIFGELDSLPVEVLDDPGFWRFLAITRFWWFVEWRESEPLARGNVLTYVDGRRNSETIPLRLYLRAKAVATSGDPQLAKELTKCTDFWRSHILRVRTGSAPPLAAAFAEMQKNSDTRLSTKPLRSFARRVNRLWTNVQLSVYDSKQAAQVIEELRP